MAFNAFQTIAAMPKPPTGPMTSNQVESGIGSQFFGSMPKLPDWNLPKEALTAAIGTNYDPFDAGQTKKNPDGIGAGGVPIKEGMIAVPRKAGTNEPMLPYGTVISVPKLNKTFTVADLKNARYTDQTGHMIDIATPGQGSKIVPEYNGPLEYKIVKLGTGRQDLKQPIKQPEPVVTVSHESPLDTMKNIFSGWPIKQ